MGAGGSTINKDPDTVLEELESQVKKAVAMDFLPAGLNFRKNLFIRQIIKT